MSIFFPLMDIMMINNSKVASSDMKSAAIAVICTLSDAYDVYTTTVLRGFYRIFTLNKSFASNINKYPLLPTNSRYYQIVSGNSD